MARTDFSILAETIGWIIELRIQQGETIALHHPRDYAGSITMMATALTAGAAIDLVGPDIDDWARSFHSADVVVTGPPILRRCLSRLEAKTRRHPRLVVITGEPLDGDTVDLCRRRLPRSKVLVAWGTTEGLGTVGDVTGGLPQPCYVGRPFVAEEALAVSADGQVLAHDAVGYIAGRVDSLSHDWPKPVNCTGDMLVSRDIGYVDQGGCVHVLGRDTDSDLIQLLGPRRSITELEAEWRSQSEAQEVALLQISGASDGCMEAGIAMERPERPKHLAKALQMLESDIGVKCRTISRERFPTTATGKIDRAALRKLFQSGRL